MSDDRRRYARVRQKLRTTLEGAMADYAPVQLEIVDLSYGGAAFASTKELYLGEIVEFTIPLAVSVPVKARVIWSDHRQKPTHYGVEFTALEPEPRRALRAHLDLQMAVQGIQPLVGDQAKPA